MKGKEEIKFYTTIFHAARIKLGLTFLEYSLADLIYVLSTNPKNKCNGWCNASKDYLAKTIGVTKQGVHKALKKLIEKDIVNKHENKRFLKITQIWYDNVIVNKVDFTNKTVNKVYTNSKQSLHNNNNITKKDIYKYISYDSQFLEDEIKRVRTRKEGKQKKMNLIILEYMLDKEMEYPTHKAFLNDFDRCRKPASPIADYSDQDYIATARFFENKNISWTLETIAKHIANKEYKLK